MEITELYYPQIRARAGDCEFTQGVEVEVYSSKDSYSDWGKIRFTPQFHPKVSAARKDPASIELGYQGSFQTVLKGYVARPYSGAHNENEVVLKDDALLLEETFLTNTFLETTPQEMIAFGLGRAGVSQMDLSTQEYPEKKRVPIFKMNVLRMIEEIHAVWGIRQPFFFSGGVFHWGTKPEQLMVYRFEYGVNILSLGRTGGAWRLETVSAPFIKHSHEIQVEHPDCSGTFEVSKVVFTTNSGGFIRTYIYF